MTEQYFVFRGIDKTGARKLRDELLETHRTYVRMVATVKMLHGGPLFDEHGETIGSCLILAAENRAGVEAWLSSEPFFGAGLFGTSTLEHWGWTYGQ